MNQYLVARYEYNNEGLEYYDNWEIIEAKTKDEAVKICNEKNDYTYYTAKAVYMLTDKGAVVI